MNKQHKRIQSILFDKNFWSVSKCKKFLKENDYKGLEVHETDNYYRFRQYDPKYKSERYISMSSITVPGIKYIISISNN